MMNIFAIENAMVAGAVPLCGEPMFSDADNASMAKVIALLDKAYDLVSEAYNEMPEISENREGISYDYLGKIDEIVDKIYSIKYDIEELKD